MSIRALGLGHALKQSFSARSGVMSARSVQQSALSRRLISTRSIKPDEAAQDILDSQRLRRPSSPHFTIYQPQLTWFGSIANRMTGIALSVLLYGFAISYATSQAISGSNGFRGEDIVAQVKKLPSWVKYTAKGLLAAPFSFHSFNGLRHLAWDMGYFLKLKGAYSSGYAVLAASAISTAGLIVY